jgi:ribonucleotide monophosphatase NagD (HAD superfamily)
MVTGKPSPFLLTDIIAKHNCVPAKMIMVGDRLDTDILWGRNTGMATLLVMTGGAQVQGSSPPEGCRRHTVKGMHARELLSAGQSPTCQFWHTAIHCWYR